MVVKPNGDCTLCEILKIRFLFIVAFQNVMEYKKASIAGVIQESALMYASESEDRKTQLDFMALLTVCHTVIPEKHEDGTHKVHKLFIQSH